MIKTKFGNAKIHKRGYYVITSAKEGNHMKYLHRLVWEDWYGRPVPEGYDIHHLNGIKTDNRIQNLQCVERSAHRRFHTQNMSDETRKKISESKKGENHPLYNKHHSEETKRKISKARNSTGYFRVYKNKDSRLKQGFIWCYRYRENGKIKLITSVDIEKLEIKVKNRGLEWIIIDNNKYLKSKEY